MNVVLGNNTFVRCKFSGCSLWVGTNGPVELIDCEFNAPELTPDEPVMSALHCLENLTLSHPEARTTLNVDCPCRAGA